MSTGVACTNCVYQRGERSGREFDPFIPVPRKFPSSRFSGDGEWQSQRSLSASCLRSSLMKSTSDYEDGNSCSSREQIRGMLTALLLLAVRIARIPRGAIPLPPRWLWVTLATAVAVTLAASGAPMLRIGHVGLGCGR